MRKLTIVAVVLLALACYDRHGLGGGNVGPASYLEVVHLRYRVPVVYLLFVAEDESARWRGGSGSNGAWHAEVRQQFSTPSGVLTEAHPVTIRGATLRADGKSFDLTDGNVLVVHVSPNGSLSVTQLPGRRGSDEPANHIVSFIKASLPHDARVQALPLPRS